MRQGNSQMSIDKNKLLIILLFIVFTSFYFIFSIPSNSIWWDQEEAIRIAKDILKGNFPLVGYLHSNGMHSFPAFYYFVSPLVYISENTLFLYGSVAFLYIIGVLILANYTYNKFGRFECILFLLFSATHVWSLFFASFFWNPNYIPFFMCLFIISLEKQINEASPVIYFHISGIFLNIIVQMMPQSIILIPAFAFILFLFKRIPSLMNQIIHVFIQIILVCPWIYFHLFILDWENLKTQGKFFKNFTAMSEYMNFLGGWELTSEYIHYASYGTNTYPFEEFFDAVLTVSSILIMMMIIYSTYLTLSKISYTNLFNIQIKTVIEKDQAKQKLCMALSILNFSCVFYFLTGMHMTPHHYQFLSPLLALNLTLLTGFKKHRIKIVWSLLLCIFLQGSFSYWRAFSEHRKPYITDVGYSDQFARYFDDNCNSESSAYILDTRGFRSTNPVFQHADPLSIPLDKFRAVQNTYGNNSCGMLIFVLRDHYEQSKIIRWILEKDYMLTDMEFKDYTIWSRKNIKEHE